MNHISRRIKNEMLKRDINQVDLANKAKVSQSTINRISNTGNNARIGTLYKIAKVLGVPVEYIVIEDEQKALLALEMATLPKDELSQLLLYIEKEKLYQQSKKAS
jgi:transcriptional regulator with XRE-family HTH domain